MQRKHLYIVLFIVAIIGLSFIQYQYLRIGLNLAGVQFNQKMGEAVEEIKKGLYPKNELTFLIGSAITEDEFSFKLSMDSVQDASAYFLNDFLKDRLIQNGIKIDYRYTLYAKDSTNYLSSAEVFDEDSKLLTYPILLEGYLPQLTNKRLVLELQFQNVNRYFMSQLNGLTIPSLVFLLVIVLVILWVYRSFYLQKNLIVTTNEFINNLTHELKTPVFSIGLATKILEEKSRDDQKPVIDLIRTQVDKLKGQIDKVLELGAIEEKSGFVQRSEFDMKPVLDRIVSYFKQESELKNFKFHSVIGEGEMVILGDPYHIENAIFSLLENAVKYSGEHIDIELLAHTEKKNLVIEVRDQGIGIEPSDLKKVFDKYYRISSGDLHNVKGYGLGLHYVKRIVHLHKGKLDVQSEVGEGSVFTLTLPLLNYVK